jgi:hypothetical protein
MVSGDGTVEAMGDPAGFGAITKTNHPDGYTAELAGPPQDRPSA